MKKFKDVKLSNQQKSVLKNAYYHGVVPKGTKLTRGMVVNLSSSDLIGVSKKVGCLKMQELKLALGDKKFASAVDTNLYWLADNRLMNNWDKIKDAPISEFLGIFRNKGFFSRFAQVCLDNNIKTFGQIEKMKQPKKLPKFGIAGYLAITKMFEAYPHINVPDAFYSHLYFMATGKYYSNYYYRYYEDNGLVNPNTK